MPRHRTDAQFIKDYTDAILYIKMETLHPEPVKFAPGRFTTKFNVRSELLSVLAELDMVSKVGIGVKTHCQWLFGDGKIDDKLVSRIIALIKHKSHKKPLDATKPILVAEKAVVTKGQKKRDAIVKADTKNAIREGKKAIQYSGTLFNLKQLSWMKKHTFHRLGMVQIDNDLTLENVRELRFTINESHLTIQAFGTFLAKEDDTIKNVDFILATLKFTNKGLAFREGYNDSKTETLVIESVCL